MDKDGKSTKEMEDLLSRLSGPYQAKRYLDLKKVDRALTRIETEDLIVDVGAGLCLDLLSLVYYRHVYGVAVDLSKQDLITGKLWAKQLGIHTRMDFCVADALNLPFQDERADVVVSYSAIEHLPKRELAQRWINEMSRITCREGTTVLTTSNKLWPTYTLIRIRNRIRKPIEAWRTNEFFFHPYEVEDMIKKAGLCPIAFEGRGLYYYHVIRPCFHGSSRFNSAVERIINLFQNFSCFKIICGRIGFRAIKKSK